MEFSPHTEEDIRVMLDAVGVASVDDLFAPIPAALRFKGALDVPAGLSESEVIRDMAALAARNRSADDLVCFLGGGAYDHHVPSLVWALLSRGELATSYTPYQPELSQGVLQALFEYQTMICSLTGTTISNAGVYDGGSALAEGVNMSVAATSRKRVVLAGAINPQYVGVLRTQGAGLQLEIDDLGSGASGTAGPIDATDAAAVVIQQPNFLGNLEDVAAAAEAAHAAGARLIVVFDLTAAGVLAAPGELGADIVVGEAAFLGNHLNFGGPYAGYVACGDADIRRLPGRLVGETLDSEGRRAFVLTLQAREQHIRREKATSNICTNQTLNTLGVAVALSWLGPQGLRELGESCTAKAHYARTRICEVAGATAAFDAPFVKEFVVRLPADPRAVCERVAADGFLAGLPLKGLVPGLDDGLLVAVTEKRTREEIDALADAIARACKEMG